jgi:hypothetical protein
MAGERRRVESTSTQELTHKPKIPTPHVHSPTRTRTRTHTNPSITQAHKRIARPTQLTTHACNPRGSDGRLLLRLFLFVGGWVGEGGGRGRGKGHHSTRPVSVRYGPIHQLAQLGQALYVDSGHETHVRHIYDAYHNKAKGPLKRCTVEAGTALAETPQIVEYTCEQESHCTHTTTHTSSPAIGCSAGVRYGVLGSRCDSTPQQRPVCTILLRDSCSHTHATRTTASRHEGSFIKPPQQDNGRKEYKKPDTGRGGGTGAQHLSHPFGPCGITTP